MPLARRSLGHQRGNLIRGQFFIDIKAHVSEFQADVGVQPFGGQGLSGTGPKTGGPHYLLRFANERTLTINTVAVGGNVELLS